MVREYEGFLYFFISFIIVKGITRFNLSSKVEVLKQVFVLTYISFYFFITTILVLRFCNIKPLILLIF